MNVFVSILLDLFREEGQVILHSVKDAVPLLLCFRGTNDKKRR